jgi:hypothetical protein
MTEKLTELLNKLNSADIFSEDDRNELQKCLWTDKKIYIVDIEIFELEQLRFITHNKEYNVLEDRDFKKLLGMTKSDYHNKKFKQILKKDFKDILQFTGLSNPDLAYYEYKNNLYVVLVQPHQRIIVIYTNTPLNSYANE